MAPAHHRCGIFLHSGRIAFQSNPGSHAGNRAAIGSFILFKGAVYDVQFPMVTVNGAAMEPAELSVKVQSLISAVPFIAMLTAPPLPAGLSS